MVDETTGIEDATEDEIRSLVVDPTRADEVGRRLAELLEDAQFNVVITWDDAESAVLAHVVGRSLGLPVTRATDVGGLATFLDALPDEPRALLLAPRFEQQGSLRALETLVAKSDGVVAGVAALESTPLLSEAEAEATGRQVVALRSGGPESAEELT